MLDFHTHILPGIDDGSRSMEETKEMLRMEKEQGISGVVFTPHFYAEQMPIKTFLREREEAYEKVLREPEIKQAFEHLYVGAEVAYFTGISKAEVLEELCIQGSKILLIEMPFAQWDEAMLKELETIVKKRKCIVVLAHVERYIPFQKKKKVMKEILELPLYVQINGGTIISDKKRKMVFKLVKNKCKILLGSDCHRADIRCPNLSKAVEILQKKGETELLAEIENNETVLFDK